MPNIYVLFGDVCPLSNQVFNVQEMASHFKIRLFTTCAVILTRSICRCRDLTGLAVKRSRTCWPVSWTCLLLLFENDKHRYQYLHRKLTKGYVCIGVPVPANKYFMSLSNFRFATLLLTIFHKKVIVSRYCLQKDVILEIKEFWAIVLSVYTSQ